MHDNWLQPLEWDSRFFGRAIARLDLPAGELRADTVLARLEQAWRMNLACVYLELPALGPGSISLGQCPGFHLVDIKTTMAMDLASLSAVEADPAVAATPRAEYDQALAPIVDDLAQKSRFALDPRFGPAQATRLYREWLRVSLQGSFCFDFLTWIESGTPAGFLTLRLRDQCPHIDLIGIAAARRGLGAGRALLAAAAARLQAAGHRQWQVVTQGHHVDAMRFYERNGFRIRRVTLFYHVWLDELSGPPSLG